MSPNDKNESTSINDERCMKIEDLQESIEEVMEKNMCRLRLKIDCIGERVD